jgi:hypothetical protein
VITNRQCCGSLCAQVMSTHYFDADSGLYRLDLVVAVQLHSLLVFLLLLAMF